MIAFTQNELRIKSTGQYKPGKTLLRILPLDKQVEPLWNSFSPSIGYRRKWASKSLLPIKPWGRRNKEVGSLWQRCDRIWGVTKESQPS